MRTREYVESLSDEERRIRTAIICREKFLGPMPMNTKMVIDQLPDYLNDLNACHEAEKTMTPDQLDQYESRLNRIVDADWIALPSTIETYIYSCRFHASSKQRNTTFLMVMLPDEGTEEQSHPSVS